MVLSRGGYRKIPFIKNIHRRINNLRGALAQEGRNESKYQ